LQGRIEELEEELGTTKEERDTAKADSRAA
jgi:hypothetical protein